MLNNERNAVDSRQIHHEQIPKRREKSQNSTYQPKDTGNRSSSNSVRRRVSGERGIVTQSVGRRACQRHHDGQNRQTTDASDARHDDAHQGVEHPDRAEDGPVQLEVIQCGRHDGDVDDEDTDEDNDNQD